MHQFFIWLIFHKHVPSFVASISTYMFWKWYVVIFSNLSEIKYNYVIDEQFYGACQYFGVSQIQQIISNQYVNDWRFPRQIRHLGKGIWSPEYLKHLYKATFREVEPGRFRDEWVNRAVQLTAHPIGRWLLNGDMVISIASDL